MLRRFTAWTLAAERHVHFLERARDDHASGSVSLRVRFEEHRTKRRERHDDRIGTVVGGHNARVDSSHVALSAASVFRGIRIDDFTPPPLDIDAESIVVARNRSEIECTENSLSVPGASSFEAEDARIDI